MQQWAIRSQAARVGGRFTDCKGKGERETSLSLKRQSVPSERRAGPEDALQEEMPVAESWSSRSETFLSDGVQVTYVP